MMFFLSILLTLFILILTYILFKDRDKRQLIKKIPGPQALPIVGHSLLTNLPSDKLWNFLREMNERYYPITRYWVGPYYQVFIRHPDDFEILLTSQKNLEKGFIYKLLFPWLKTGLLTGDGDKWQSRRKLLTPAFHFAILKKYLNTINEHGKKWTESLKKEGQETVQNLLPFSANITLNVICEATMGVALDEVDEMNAKKYKNAIFTLGHIIIFRVIRPYLRDWMLSPFWGIGRIQKTALKTVHTFTDKILKQRREYHKNYNHTDLANFNKDMTEIGSKKKLAMLDLLLKIEKDGMIDNKGIKEELDTFMFAGHDTTSMALVFTIILLAEHKEIQTAARLEIKDTFEKNGGTLMASDIQGFPYLERCIKESMRMFPPVPMISRLLIEDITLGGYLIPSGTDVACHIFDLHHDSNFWPEPEKYDPDRFLPERFQGRHPFSYIPFSAGPRNCIGQKFAMLELKCLIAYILYNFELEPVTKVSDIKLQVDLVARPSSPVFVKFIRIEKNNWKSHYSNI